MFRDQGPIPPFNLSYPAMNDPTAISLPPEDYIPHSQDFYDPQDEAPLMSAGLNTTVDWSDLNLPLDNTAYSTGYNQSPSYITLDNINSGPQCFPTSTSSTEGSDTASDYISHSGNQGSPFRPDLTAAPSVETNNYNRLSSCSFTSMPQNSTPSLSTSVPHSDAQLRTSASPTEFEGSPALHADAYERHGFTVHDAQKLAHPETPTEAMNSLSIPGQKDDTPQSLWAGSLDPPPGTLVSPQMVEGLTGGVGVSPWR